MYARLVIVQLASLSTPGINPIKNLPTRIGNGCINHAPRKVNLKMLNHHEKLNTFSVDPF